MKKKVQIDILLFKAAANKECDRFSGKVYTRRNKAERQL